MTLEGTTAPCAITKDLCSGERRERRWSLEAETVHQLSFRDPVLGGARARRTLFCNRALLCIFGVHVSSSTRDGTDTRSVTEHFTVRDILADRLPTLVGLHSTYGVAPVTLAEGLHPEEV